jgi:hypothetical protein
LGVTRFPQISQQYRHPNHTVVVKEERNLPRCQSIRKLIIVTKLSEVVNIVNFAPPGSLCTESVIRVFHSPTKAVVHLKLRTNLQKWLVGISINIEESLDGWVNPNPNELNRLA